MGNYSSLIKLIIAVVVGALLIGGIMYGTHLWKESGFEQERTEYRSTIAETAFDKETLLVEKQERKAVDAFEKVEEKIDTESNVTRTYTKEMLNNEKVTEFTDSF